MLSINTLSMHVAGIFLGQEMYNPDYLQILLWLTSPSIQQIRPNVLQAKILHMSVLELHLQIIVCTCWMIVNDDKQPACILAHITLSRKFFFHDLCSALLSHNKALKHL